MEETELLYSTIGRLYVEFQKMKNYVQQARSVVDAKDKEIVALKEQLVQDDTTGKG